MGAASVSWPPPRPPEKPIDDRPWDPGHSQEPTLHEEADRLVYVVVDEVIDTWVGLSMAPWPHADSEGRLRFRGQHGPVEVGTSRKALEEFLATAKKDRSGKRGDAGADAQSVPIRIGMTFGARVKRGRAASLLDRLDDHAAHGEARIDDLAKILTRPVDLTDKGRLLAKLAAYGAVLSTLPEHLGEKWRLEEEIER